MSARSVASSARRASGRNMIAMFRSLANGVGHHTFSLLAVEADLGQPAGNGERIEHCALYLSEFGEIATALRKANRRILAMTTATPSGCIHLSPRHQRRPGLLSVCSPAYALAGATLRTAPSGVRVKEKRRTGATSRRASQRGRRRRRPNRPGTWSGTSTDDLVIDGADWLASVSPNSRS